MNAASGGIGGIGAIGLQGSLLEPFPSFHANETPSNRDSIFSQASSTSTTPTDYSASEQDPSSSSSSRPRTFSTLSTISNLSSSSPSASPSPRSRRDKHELHAARLQRTASTSLSLAKKESTSKTKRFHRESDPAAALAALEPAHDQGLVRMAFAEQQRWITVQQKTFTKWCVSGKPFIGHRSLGRPHACVSLCGLWPWLTRVSSLGSTLSSKPATSRSRIWLQISAMA